MKEDYKKHKSNLKKFENEMRNHIRNRKMDNDKQKLLELSKQIIALKEKIERNEESDKEYLERIEQFRYLFHLLMPSYRHYLKKEGGEFALDMIKTLSALILKGLFSDVECVDIDNSSLYIKKHKDDSLEVDFRIKKCNS